MPSVVPLPASSRSRSDASPFVLNPAVRIAGDPAAAAHLSRLLDAVTGMQLHPAGEGTIRLLVSPGGAPESYRLVADAAAVTVTGADAAGLFYGVQTLGQLVTRRKTEWVVPDIEIEDAPRFRYRGVMLDVARHFFGVAVVRAYIDRAASLKCNHLHLHLTDDQGWRIEIASRPELTARAASTAVGGDPGGFFTSADYADIVAYAASRHMTVVPEVDLPGHTHAVSLAYPGLASEPVITDEVRDAVERFGGALPAPGVAYSGIAVGFSSLRIHDEQTYAFVSDVVGELAAMTPGPFLHLGGDEALGTTAEDYAAFVARALEIVTATGKTPILWHEAGAVPHLPPNLVGQYWGYVTPIDGHDRAARAVVAAGGRLILSPADAVYLDMKPRQGAPLGLTWANGCTGVERAYSWEPTAIVAGVDEEDILGVEAPMWTETIRSLDDIDAMAFPRLAAAAEVAWSPAARFAPQRTWESFRERVGTLGPLWTALGIRFDRSPEIPWNDR